MYYLIMGRGAVIGGYDNAETAVFVMNDLKRRWGFLTMVVVYRP